ncbi:MAG: beta-galactosidase [Limnochordia bacterium]|jgi:beta-galactosidase
MYFGVDYYPEHWPEERWEIDAQLMQAAHLNVVRVAEFAWAKLEPSEGHFDFAWLDRAIEVLNKHGLKVIIGTPTATPPKWLIDKHPDILPRGADGHVRGFGSRCHYCATNENYQWYTDVIVGQLAKHYGQHPGVIGWQTDNEFGCHSTVRCYCDSCQEAFRRWLQRKYGTLEALNETWGTIFWSQTYTDWDQVIIPRKTVAEHNPSLLLDFYRFSSDMKVEYQRRQIEILRRHTANQFITHNLMGLFPEIDYYKLGDDLDFVSWDNYPRLLGAPDKARLAMTHDLMRGIRQQNFWVMEEQSGPSGWGIVQSTPRPGEIRLWTYQAVSRGADGIVYFRWRTCRFGTEQFWHGVINHDGLPRRRYQEVQQTGSELKKLAPLLEGTVVKNEVAVLYSYDELWALEIQPNNPRLKYTEVVSEYYRCLHERNVGVDFVNHDDDFSQYKVLIAPLIYMVSPNLAAKLGEFVRRGGVLITNFRSGVKDWDNIVTDKPLPGELADLLGIEIGDYDSFYGDGVGIKLELDGEVLEGSADTWCDIITPHSAKTLGTYTSEYYASEAAVTENAVGEGRAMYIGTRLDSNLTAKLVDYALSKAGASRGLLGNGGIEVAVREKGSIQLIFLLNHTDQKQSAALPGRYVSLIWERPVSGEIELEPYGVEVLREEP